MSPIVRQDSPDLQRARARRGALFDRLKPLHGWIEERREAIGAAPDEPLVMFADAVVEELYGAYREWLADLQTRDEDAHDERAHTAEAVRAWHAATTRLDEIVNAGTRGRQRQGEATRRRVLAMQRDGKTIAKTAEELTLSERHVARIRGAAKRGASGV